MIAAVRTNVEQVQDYIAEVVAGDIVVGKLVRCAVNRHLADIDNAEARGMYFDEGAAEAAIEFFPECLRHSIGKWAGEPFVLEPWQKFIVASVFGWKNSATHKRRFRRAFISVARKNGKTTTAAGIPIQCMYLDDPPEPGAQVYCVATKEEQAMLLWREAERMLRKSPELCSMTTFRHKRILFDAMDSFFTPLGSDSDSTDGLNPHVVVKDELHAWRERHRGLHEKLSTGGGSREQPLEIVITTAGDDESTIWLEEDDYAQKVVESVITGDVIDDRLFVFVARIDDDDDPFDESCWQKANPNLEVSVSLEYLRGQANEAKQKPTAFNSFVRYHCNRKVTSSERAIQPELWAAGKREKPTVFDRKACHGAFDLGRANDFAALARCEAFYREGQSPIYYVETKSFTCADSPMLQREPVRGFVASKLLEVHPNNSVDFNEFQSTALEWQREHDISTIAYDPTFAKQMGQSLFNEHGLQVFEFSQGHRFYNEPIREFLKALADGRIIHNGDPVQTWQALNLTIDRNARDQWMPNKSDPTNKIDAMVAILMAFSECLFAENTDVSGPLVITL